MKRRQFPQLSTIGGAATMTGRLAGVARAARRMLFGAGEMNRCAWKCAHDLRLADATRGTLGFLMYPQAQTREGRFDALDVGNFRYTITSRELTQA